MEADKVKPILPMDIPKISISLVPIFDATSVARYKVLVDKTAAALLIRPNSQSNVAARTSRPTASQPTAAMTTKKPLTLM